MVACVVPGESVSGDESQVVELQVRAVKEHEKRGDFQTRRGCSGHSAQLSRLSVAISLSGKRQTKVAGLHLLSAQVTAHFLS